jgi:hypothetical protein
MTENTFRKCSIAGCNNPLKLGAHKYCSIQCAHIEQKRAHRGMTAHERHMRQATAFLEQGGLYGYVSPGSLSRVLKAQYGERCLECGWNQRNPSTGRVPTEVEHIDGDWQNNRLSNLTLLCPNCHALTPTFRGLNRGRGRAHRLGKLERNEVKVPVILEVSRNQLELCLPT